MIGTLARVVIGFLVLMILIRFVCFHCRSVWRSQFFDRKFNHHNFPLPPNRGCHSQQKIAAAMQFIHRGRSRQEGLAFSVLHLLENRAGTNINSILVPSGRICWLLLLIFSWYVFPRTDRQDFDDAFAPGGQPSCARGRRIPAKVVFIAHGPPTPNQMTPLMANAMEILWPQLGQCCHVLSFHKAKQPSYQLSSRFASSILEEHHSQDDK